MQTFDDAVRAAKDAKTSIAALEKAEALAREALAALRVEFTRKEQALIDSVALYQKQAHEARAALQSALQRINDAPIEEQAAALPFDLGNPETHPNQGALIGAGTLAEIIEPRAIESFFVTAADDEEVEPRDNPGFEPLTEEADRAATGFAS